MVKIALIDCKDSEIVQNAVVKMLREFNSILKTATADVNKEFLQNQSIPIGLDLDY